MEIDRAERPLSQFRKLLKKLPDNPAPDEVHRLRTRARKIEAVAAALKQADAKRTKRLLKAIKPVRKAAGDVRDMDVLTGDLLHMPQDSNKESLVRLVEHLGIVRSKTAGDLLQAVGRQRTPARRSLKRYGKLLEALANGSKSAPIEVARTLESNDGQGSLAGELMAELRDWPRLAENNIHPFRLKVKELRYVLQLFPQADQGLVDALGKVKDEIGDWHDWQQLHLIARDVLDAQKDKGLLARIRSTAKEKLTHALEGANGLRRRYLQSGQTRRKAS